MMLVKVKVLKDHGNAYGDAYAKAVDSEYALPADAAETLAAAGLVELPAKAKGKAITSRSAADEGQG